MKKFIFLFTLALLSFSSRGQDHEGSEKINVLFIGNSLTYYHDMPQMLQEMVNETDPHINIDQITYPGFSLYAHLEDIVEEGSEDNVRTRKKIKGEITATEKKIREKNWDIIVMQTGGINILIPEIRNLKVDPAIRQIMNSTNCEAEFILFSTWITKNNYPKEYCYPAVVVDSYAKPGEKFCSPQIRNEDGYFELLMAGYEELATQNNLTLSNHSRKFKEVTQDHPEIELLEDDMHPSKKGAFLSASIFYELISGKKANSLAYNAGLNNDIAMTIKECL